jgi:S-adenosylmethionine:tRNA ribosyltransferase-isomerase
MKSLKLDIPEELIAQYPLKDRTACRLLCLDRGTGSVSHKFFFNILDYLQRGDLLVLNDTKVIKARFFARKETGGRVEVLLLKPVYDGDGVWQALLRGRNIKAGNKLFVDEIKEIIEVKATGDDAVFTLSFGSNERLNNIIEKTGKIPLPPYIKRESNEDDAVDYQTVFARKDGSVASPTASLHFTENLLEQIKEKGVRIAYITLHVGYGTFSMIKDINTHKMHSEYFYVPDDTAEKIKECRKIGKKIWAVGTTVVRTLESAFNDNLDLIMREGQTALFIKDPYRFKVVDTMVTNFHHPCTSLILLVSAFAGHDLMERSYNEAIQNKYRFLSYGDSMLII